MEEEKAKKYRSEAIETYAEDMAKAIREGAGTVKNIIHEREAEEAEKKNLSPETKKNRFFVSVGILLLALAFAAVSFIFFRKNTATVPVAKQFTPLIFTDRAISIDVSGLKKEDIAQKVLSEVGSVNVKVGGVEGIYPVENKQIIGLRRFIALSKIHFTPVDNTQFVSDDFLMGVVKNQNNAASASGSGFFILLKVRSSQDIFDSLRAWEPSFLYDLHGFLGLNITSETNYLFTKDFTDGIVENKNARVLYDKDGNIVVAYIFADNNSIIITDSDSAAHEIMLRLASAQVGQ
jgi:hypothetical protein